MTFKNDISWPKADETLLEARGPATHAAHALLLSHLTSFLSPKKGRSELFSWQLCSTLFFVLLKWCCASCIISALLYGSLLSPQPQDLLFAFSFLAQPPFVVLYLAYTFSNFAERQLKHGPSTSSPTLRRKKVIVTCGRRWGSILVYSTSLLGSTALLLPHRPVRWRLHLLGVLIIMAQPLAEELILASI